MMRVGIVLVAACGSKYHRLVRAPAAQNSVSPLYV